MTIAWVVLRFDKCDYLNYGVLLVVTARWLAVGKRGSRPSRIAGAGEIRRRPLGVVARRSLGRQKKLLTFWKLLEIQSRAPHLQVDQASLDRVQTQTSFYLSVPILPSAIPHASSCSNHNDFYVSRLTFNHNGMRILLEAGFSALKLFPNSFAAKSCGRSRSKANLGIVCSGHFNSLHPCSRPSARPCSGPAHQGRDQDRQRHPPPRVER